MLTGVLALGFLFSARPFVGSKCMSFSPHGLIYVGNAFVEKGTRSNTFKDVQIVGRPLLTSSFGLRKKQSLETSFNFL